MTQELIQKPSDTAAAVKPNGSPLSEGPISKKDILLRSISERCVARFKSRPMSAGFQGALCGSEAAFHHSVEKDPDAEAKSISLELMPLKFDISREAYGTEDTYVVMKSAGELSFFALHGIIRKDGEACGVSTLALRLPQELLPEILGQMKADPGFINEILHSVVPQSAALAFSIKTRIDVISDRNYFVFGLNSGG
jgi:hypothetical protein